MTAVREQLEQALDDAMETGETTVAVDIPDNLEHGDYTTTAALEVANRRGEDPREFAQDLVDRLELPDAVETVEIAGPGYINFHVDKARLGDAIVSAEPGASLEAPDEKVIVEHTSPNPNKPLHMGTMRCAVLGDAVARLAAFVGYEVEVQNLINDLGRQSATTVYAYRNFLDELDEDDRAEKDDFWIGLLYSEAAQHLKLNAEENNHVDEIIRAIEEQDNETAELKNELVEKSVKGQLETAFRTDVFYDALIFERDIVGSGLYEEGLEQIKSMDHVYEAKNREDEGCIVLDISDYEDELGELQKPYKILVRSDGTATYVAKDIVLTLWKYGVIDGDLRFEAFLEQPNGAPLWTSGGTKSKEFGDADQVINVIGAEQQYPQQIIKYSLDALGFADAAERFDHTHFKFVYLPGRVAYSGRKGNWVGKHGDAVLDRAYELALDEVELRHDHLREEAQQEIAEHVAVAAVRYFLLKFTREKEIDFSFEKALDWEGDSGPYLLYAAARAHGILDQLDGSDHTFTAYDEDVTWELIRTLEQFDDTVMAAYERREPAKLAHYLKDLAETFNTFYHHCPVADAETAELQASRAAVVAAFAQVMETGLDLLGLEPLEQM